MTLFSFTAFGGAARSAYWRLVMFYEFIFWSANRMDQHVSFIIFWPISKSLFNNLTQLNTTRMSLQSALIGFLLSRLLPTPLTAQEIIVVQTTAVATGTVRVCAHRTLRFDMNVRYYFRCHWQLDLWEFCPR